MSRRPVSIGFFARLTAWPPAQPLDTTMADIEERKTSTSGDSDELKEKDIVISGAEVAPEANAENVLHRGLKARQ